MKIEGVINKIIYSNAENNYAIISFDCEDGQEITAVGTFPALSEGESLILEGKWVNNGKYGKQVEVSKVYLREPVGKEAIYKYLNSGFFKGVGPATALSIVETFGEDSLRIIEETPEKLAVIKGITVKKAYEIAESYKSHMDMKVAVIFLQSLNIGVGTAIKIYKAYGSEVKKIVDKNPYQLIDDIEGIGFATADVIALNYGFAKDSRFRVRAAAEYVLKDAVIRKGHTYLPMDKLIEETRLLLNLERFDASELIEDVIKDSVVLGRVVIKEKVDHIAAESYKNYNTENAIAFNLVRLMRDNPEKHLDFDSEIAAFEKANDIILHNAQKEAIANCLQYGVTVITGGPGTGKTTIIKCVIAILENLEKSIALCAPTGRASKRLSEATGRDAKTIHRLLGLNSQNGEPWAFVYSETNKMKEDVIIVDEVSMCDIFIFNSLLKAIKQGANLILVGDKDQLPSVGSGNVLGDIIDSGKIPVNYLTQIYRQEEGSLIIKNAHLINRGKMPIFDNQSKDFFFSKRYDSDEVLTEIVDMLTVRIPKFKKITTDKIQVLSPVKKGITGVDNINETIQSVLNPKSVYKKELKYGQKVFREGDRVIHLVNNYQMDWHNHRENTAGSGVFNGDIGKIVNVDESLRALIVEFEDGRESVYQVENLDQLALAYAISIHKSQGSEFDIVIIPIVGGFSGIMTRNLLYTAVTRAKNMVVLIGKEEAIYAMVNNNSTTRRYTMLKDFLLEMTD